MDLIPERLLHAAMQNNRRLGNWLLIQHSEPDPCNLAHCAFCCKELVEILADLHIALAFKTGHDIFGRGCPLYYWIKSWVLERSADIHPHNSACKPPALSGWVIGKRRRTSNCSIQGSNYPKACNPNFVYHQDIPLYVSLCPTSNSTLLEARYLITALWDWAPPSNCLPVCWIPASSASLGSNPKSHRW